MSCDNNWRKTDIRKWAKDPEAYEARRWTLFKEEWKQDHNILFGEDPRNHADRHLDWDKFETHLFSKNKQYHKRSRGQDGRHDKAGNPVGTGYFAQLEQLDRVMHDFLGAKQAEIQKIEAVGRGEVHGHVTTTGLPYGESHHGDSKAMVRGEMVVEFLGLCNNAFVKMIYDGSKWNVITGYPHV